ncbi:MAG: hypothetical protein JHC84_06120 [Solirubrobacteraceae bacterium]|nr:hypothetical protein [Solirubrobacteraceae bacterium]
MADVERALEQWREGEQRVDGLPDDRLRGKAHDLIAQTLIQLRRRLGGPFTVEELADLYEQGTDWVVEIAHGLAPDHPALWDPRLIADATFARYVRGARDFAGGRRL